MRILQHSAFLSLRGLRRLRLGKRGGLRERCERGIPAVRWSIANMHGDLQKTHACRCELLQCTVNCNTYNTCCIRPISLLRLSLLRFVDSDFPEFPTDMRIPLLEIKIMLESNPLKSRILVRRLAVVRVSIETRIGNSLLFSRL